MAEAKALEDAARKKQEAAEKALAEEEARRRDERENLLVERGEVSGRNTRYTSIYLFLDARFA